MTWAFVTYLTLKGLKKIWPHIVDIFTFLPDEKKPSFMIASILGLIIAAIIFIVVKKSVSIKEGLMNDRHSINSLFTAPLIFAAALLSFAHGANDVANAIGPLAAISDAVNTGGISSKASIPFWVMSVGALGIVVGLALYGPKLIKTVGSEITELDQMRAFSIMMAAAITVVIASQLGLPVSSTHIAVGAIFGVGCLREWLDSKDMSVKQEALHREVEKHRALKAELAELKAAGDYKRQVELIEAVKIQKRKVKSLKRSLRENYVKRGMVKKIIAAWVITVPAAAALSAIIFFILKGVAN